jgi:aspartate/methionine/tyrosine aminotransferase
VRHLKACRDALIPALQGIDGLSVATPKGGMYAFFQLPKRSGTASDSLVVAKQLVTEAGLGLAPGNAFAPEADGWLRWCFASKDIARLHQGVARLQRWLA